MVIFIQEIGKKIKETDKEYKKKMVKFMMVNGLMINNMEKEKLRFNTELNILVNGLKI
jgi:hypothetical protein